MDGTIVYSYTEIISNTKSSFKILTMQTNDYKGSGQFFSFRSS